MRICRSGRSGPVNWTKDGICARCPPCIGSPGPLGRPRERRRQAAHPAKVKPELLARAPSQVWSWDITKLRGPSKGTYYHLYVLIDIFSRYNPGWLVSTCE